MYMKACIKREIKKGQHFAKPLIYMARPARFERATAWFVARHSCLIYQQLTEKHFRKSTAKHPHSAQCSHNILGKQTVQVLDDTRPSFLAAPRWRWVFHAVTHMLSQHKMLPFILYHWVNSGNAGFMPTVAAPVPPPSGE